MVAKLIRTRFWGLAIVLLLSACGQDTSDSEYIARARDYLAAADLSAASIELRNAIRQSPDNQEARLLLGQVYFRMGDIPSAEKELLKVHRSSGGESNVIMPLLARVWAKLGRNDQVLNIDVTGLSPESVASILATQAVIHMSLSEVEQADRKVMQARELAPDSPAVLNAQARLRYFHRDYELADELLTQFHELEPNDASMWALHGDVRRMMKDYSLADEYYSKAIELDDTPVGLDYRMRRAFLRIQEGQWDKAQQDIDILLEKVPQNTRANYAQGLVYFFNSQYEEAVSSFVLAVSDKFSFPEVLMYLGLAHYQLGQFGRAYGYAQDFYALVTDNPTGNKLLSKLWVSHGKFTEAERLIRTVLEQSPDDVEALNILANSLSGQRRLDEAIDVLSKVVRLDPDSVTAQVRLGVGYARTGQSGKAVELIEDVIEQDPGYGQADMVLVLTYLKDNDFEKALAAAQSYRQRNPADVAPLLMLARVYLQMGDSEAAKKTYLEVIELEPGNLSANHRLAAMAAADKDLDSARKYYQAVLKAQPHALSTLVSLAFLESTENNAEAMVSYLEEAIEAHPDAVEPRVVLAKYHLTSGRPDKVSLALSGLSDDQISQPVVLRVLGQSQLAEKKYADARYSFERLIENHPGWVTAEDHRLLGMAYEGLGNKEKVAVHMQKALEMEPNSVQSHLALATRAFGKADTEELERQLKAIEELAPDNYQLKHLQAAYARVKGDQKGALRLFQQVFDTAPSTGTMLNLKQQYELLGDRKAALELLSNWVSDNPGDVPSRLALASEYMLAGDLDSSVEEYLAILQLDENNLVALNNLAWSLKSKDPRSALQYAQRAASIAKDSLEILDTLAVVQSANNQHSNAWASIRKVLKGAPDNPTYVYHSALIASQGGKPGEAVEILNTLLAGDKKFPEREEAVTLRESLSDR